jgi:prepilin-type N-terminal cleavage/methylation domain-containing protein
MKKQLDNNFGYSLIELMQALVIFSIVMTIVFGLFIQVSKALQKRESRQQLLDESNNALNYLAGSISNSSGWISGDTTGITIIARSGMPVKINWDQRDSVIYYGDKLLLAKGIKVPTVKMLYLPSNASLYLYSKEEWFEELDFDRNGILEGPEIKRASTVEISFQTSTKGQNIKLKSTVRLPKSVADTTNMGY